jgi:hypothetical protein
MNDSKVLDKVGVRDMGRRSDSMLLGGLDFGMGMTLASFLTLGTVLSTIRLIKYGAYWFCFSHTEKSSQDPSWECHPVCMICARLFDFADLGVNNIIGQVFVWISVIMIWRKRLEVYGDTGEKSLHFICEFYHVTAAFIVRQHSEWAWGGVSCPVRRFISRNHLCESLMF